MFGILEIEQDLISTLFHHLLFLMAARIIFHQAQVIMRGQVQFAIVPVLYFSIQTGLKFGIEIKTLCLMEQVY